MVKDVSSDIDPESYLIDGSNARNFYVHHDRQMWLQKHGVSGWTTRL